MEPQTKKWIGIGALLGASWGLIIWAQRLHAAAVAEKVAPSAAPSATSTSNCEAQLKRCVELEDYETKRCAKLSMAEAARVATAASAASSPIGKWLATGDPRAFAAASAAPSTAPDAPEAMHPVDDLDAILGTWIDHELGDYTASGKLVTGGVRVVIKKNGKKAKTPYSLKFWAPRPGHDTSSTVSGGCGVYRDVHKDSGTGWRAAYCSGYGKGDSIATHLKLETNGKKLRLDLENWLLATLVQQ